MKNFETFEEIFHSSGEESRGLLPRENKLTRKRLVICFILDSLQLKLFSSCDCMVILESVKSARTCVSNVLSSISEYANDSFKENSRREAEREAFVETLVAVL